MLRDFFLVGMGSFLGGGSRFIVSKVIQAWAPLSFPLGTFAVNILGCLIIGFLSGLHWPGGWMSPSMKLVLTTGFCGGFTTFSTFMNESTGAKAYRAHRHGAVADASLQQHRRTL